MVRAERIGGPIRGENMVRTEPLPPARRIRVSLPIHTGEALVMVPDTTRSRINRAAGNVIGVMSRTVTQSNWVSKDTTLTTHTWALSEDQVSLSPQTSSMHS